MNLLEKRVSTFASGVEEAHKLAKCKLANVASEGVCCAGQLSMHLERAGLRIFTMLRAQR
eukprot:4613104-Pleurochrysis_carterae.AAC.1